MTSRKTQREALLAALKKRRMTTEQIRSQLHIGMPATRIFELKQDGHKIKSELIKINTHYGETKVARYTLQRAA